MSRVLPLAAVCARRLSKASAGWRRSGSATITRRSGCSRPSRSFRRSFVPLIEKVEGHMAWPSTQIAQVLCTEYDAGVGIGWHRGQAVSSTGSSASSPGSPCVPCFGATVGEKWQRYSALKAALRARALPDMSEGDPRSIWEHSIPAVEARSDIRSPSAQWRNETPERRGSSTRVDWRSGQSRKERMARRSGSADLPLHGGRVPPRLATRMHPRSAPSSLRKPSCITTAMTNSCRRIVAPVSEVPGVALAP